MLKGSLKLLAVGACALAVAAGCGSSKSPSSSNTTAAPNSGTGGSSGGGKTITVGVLTDLTGPAASGNKTSPLGVKAGVVMAQRDGYTLKYVVADTQTSPAAALTAAKTLVEQDHVMAVLVCSALAFSAAPYLTAQHVPVIGAAEDGPEWKTSLNMFPVYGYVDTTKVSTTFGALMKMEGVTTLGSLGYSISPSSAESAKANAVSAEAAGLKVGYLNAQFPFGSTNVAPVALAMKSAHVDGFTSSVDPNTGFALITAARQAGVPLKVALLATGYGGDTLQAGPGTLQEAQNVYFLSSFEPMELNTPATQQFKSDLQAVSIQTDPTYAEYVGYTAVALLLQGLKGAGATPTQSSLLTSLSGITNFTAAGLFGGRTLNLTDRTGYPGGLSDNCTYITKLVGSTFMPVQGADPICGTVIPGKTVSAS
jgi:branched-chain amino acid transport system substrate-binding protein